MTQEFSYSTSYILDKAHFQECFQQSVEQDTTIKPYYKAIAMTLVGGALVVFSELNPYAAWFIFSLGILEALAVYYQKPWWVMRQMLSKAAKGEVKLVIDDEGIRCSSYYAKLELCWADITKLQITDQGWLVYHAGGKHYISKSTLSEQAHDFLIRHAKTI